jgi:formylglycine-generating enzyme required for sulfatase activity
MFSRAVTSGLLTVSALALAAGVAYAGVVMDMVPVGDPGNAPDTRYATPGYGAVNYTYQIGKYEVTAGQYTEFLNDVAKTDTYGLYNTSMWNDTYGCKIQRSGTSGSYTYSVASDRADHPINFVSFWDSCRFVNWLQNGQPTGLQNASTTEDGAYTLNGYTGNSGISIQRNSGAKWFLPSDNEWYKAAFYDPGKPGGAGYWDYPIRSNTEPKRESPPGTDLVNGSWNVNQVVGPPYYTTKVGAYSAKPSTSAYGTYDQGGNQGEWCDTNFAPGDTRRVLLCACWGSAPPFYGARDRGGYLPEPRGRGCSGHPRCGPASNLCDTGGFKGTGLGQPGK